MVLYILADILLEIKINSRKRIFLNKQSPNREHVPLNKFIPH